MITLLIIALLFLTMILSGLSYVQKIIPFLVFAAFAFTIIKYTVGNKNELKQAIAKTVEAYENKQSPEPDSHASQHNYSTAYSYKKTESRNTVKDPSLSEAERNVLYGK
jgi:uncharacterized protein YacL